MRLLRFFHWENKDPTAIIAWSEGRVGDEGVHAVNLGYRSSVIGVFTNDEGRVMVGERRDHPGNWQLPQGGVEPGEGVVEAFQREMTEETGCGEFRILDAATKAVLYDFPPDLNRPITKRYRGQSLHFFLARYHEGKGPDPSRSDGEFQNFRWVTPLEVLQGVIEWKRDAYLRGFAMLGIQK
jgi:putative (di)nucleoside polyphosphate hydrolase